MVDARLSVLFDVPCSSDDPWMTLGKQGKFENEGYTKVENPFDGMESLPV